MSKMSFEKACTRYPHRFTMDHIPAWARQPAVNHNTDVDQPLRYYAPQYRSDREWYDRTYFPGQSQHHQMGFQFDCYSHSPTFPLGTWLDKPFTKETP